MLRAATPERWSAFSDGVFAVLIAVLVLDLRPPELPAFKALLLRWPTWLSYAVSYLFIAIVWANQDDFEGRGQERLSGSAAQPGSIVQQDGALTYASRPEGGMIAIINLPVRDAQPPFRL